MGNAVDWVKEQTVIGDVDEWVNEHTVVGKYNTWLDEHGLDDVRNALIPVAVAMMIPGVREVTLAALTKAGASAASAAKTVGGWVASGAKVVGGKIVSAGGKVLSEVAGLGEKIAGAGGSGGGLGNLVASGIGAAASIYSSYLAAGATEDAARAAAEAYQQGIKSSEELQREMFYMSRGDLEPWREAGKNALTQLTGKVEEGPGEYEASDYQNWLVGEGVKALDRSAAARGRLHSGAHEKAITQFGQNISGAGRRNWLDEYYASLRPLQSMAGVGQTAVNTGAQAGARYAGDMSNVLMSGAGGIANANVMAGNARASGYINTSNAINRGIENWMFLNRYGRQPQPTNYGNAFIGR